MIVRIKGFHVFRDRHGKWRCYHRATRTAIDLNKTPIGSAGFLAECDRLFGIANKRADRGAAIAAQPRTLGALIRDYKE